MAGIMQSHTRGTVARACAHVRIPLQLLSPLAWGCVVDIRAPIRHPPKLSRRARLHSPSHARPCAYAHAHTYEYVTQPQQILAYGAGMGYKPRHRALCSVRFVCLVSCVQGDASRGNSNSNNNSPSVYVLAHASVQPGRQLKSAEDNGKQCKYQHPVGRTTCHCADATTDNERAGLANLEVVEGGIRSGGKWQG